MKKRYALYALIAAIAAALLTGGVVYAAMRNAKGETDVAVSVNEIREIAQLATVEYHLSTILDRRIPMSWYEWKNARLLVMLKGVVKGSVDLNRADIQMPKAGEKAISIRFRKGAIVVSNPEIGPEDIKVITAANPNIIHPIKDSDRNAAKRDAIAELRKTALDGGIVAKTAEEARTLLTKFLGGLGYTATVEFEDVPLAQP